MEKTRSGKGGIMLVLLLAILLVASIYFTDGFLPKVTIDSLNPKEGEGVVVDEPLTGSDKTLQLKTIKFKQCGNTTAVDFLVDVSGSMRYGSKMTELKKALRNFTASYPDNGVLGMQTFSVKYYDVIPISYYKDVKSQVAAAINSITPISGTYTKDAFIFAKQKLDAAIPKFPNYKFAMIFISDGIPETEQSDNLCSDPTKQDICGLSDIGTCRCFAREQDPIEIATQLKQNGIRIFSVAYVDNTLDKKFNALLQPLMRGVASSEADYYMMPVDNQITEILNQIATKLCE